MFGYPFLKKILFKHDAEMVHHHVMHLLKLISKSSGGQDLLKKIFNFNKTLDPVDFLGMHFRNRIGLAAGFDKNGDFIQALSTCGFGHIELGTVTPLPQMGNAKKRLFRLPLDQALINRMGFNNKGISHLIHNLKSLEERTCLLGGNIGKNKDTPNDSAWKDFLFCFENLYEFVDYFTINISSPNTPGLRNLQSVEEIRKIIYPIENINQKSRIRKPIFIKLSPDTSLETLQLIFEEISQTPIEGIVLTNTTIDRNGLKTSKETLSKCGDGGLSGRPLFDKSNQILKLANQTLASHKKIIAVGGVFDRHTYETKINSGADLIQIYTGFIYEGPQIVSKILCPTQ